MELLSWNLNGNTDALGLALKYLARRVAGDSVVGCFQESPPLPGMPPGLRAAPLQDAGIALVYSDTLRLVGRPKFDGSKRMMLTRLRAASSDELQVCVYHARDKIYFGEPEQRGGAAALIRREIDELTDASKSLILVGDFNAEPDSREVSLRDCLYAVTGARDRTHHTRHFGRASRRLFVVEPDSPVEGSFLLNWGVKEWKTYDFAIVDATLRERTTARVKIDLDGVDLLRPFARTPHKEAYSDHLPVAVGVDFR